MLDFDNVDFEEEHLTLLEERNGQWLDSTGNLSLWLSQGCYLSGKCLIESKLNLAIFYEYFACPSFCLCPINVKMAEMIRPKFFWQLT